MLDVGKERAEKMNLQSDDLSWLCANAQELPLPDNSFDLYTIAFGIRNVIEIPKVRKAKFTLHIEASLMLSAIAGWKLFPVAYGLTRRTS